MVRLSGGAALHQNRMVYALGVILFQDVLSVTAISPDNVLEGSALDNDLSEIRKSYLVSAGSLMRRRPTIPFDQAS